MFGLGGRATAAQPSVNFSAAEQEMEMVTDLFNKIVHACHQKCIPVTYLEGELNKGESVCIDRCVAKYFDVNTQIGSKLTNMSQPR